MILKSILEALVLLAHEVNGPQWPRARQEKKGIVNPIIVENKAKQEGMDLMDKRKQVQVWLKIRPPR